MAQEEKDKIEFKNKFIAGKMTEWVKALVIKAGDTSLIPRTHVSPTRYPSSDL